MCQSIADGGKRCAQAGRLEKLTAQELAPHTPDAPALDWESSDLTQVWATHDKADACAAIESVDNAAVHDPRTFRDVQEAAQNVGGRLHGAAFRIKSPESLARKIATKSEAARLKRENSEATAIAAKITDVTRYTICAEEHDGIVGTAKSSVAALEKAGWHVHEAEHSYIPGNPYKGLHLLLRHNDGQIIELQIQSERSQAIKDKTHELYEISRNTSLGLSKRRAAQEEGKTLYADLPAPAGIDKLAKLGGMVVRKKEYR